MYCALKACRYRHLLFRRRRGKHREDRKEEIPKGFLSPGSLLPLPYLHEFLKGLFHLFRIRDPLGIRLLVIHNHAFFERLVSEYRQKGCEGR